MCVHLKLKATSLSEVEFRLIPPKIVLKIFDVGEEQIWSRLPLMYQIHKDFMLETWCSGTCDTDKGLFLIGKKVRRKECKFCRYNIDKIPDMTTKMRLYPLSILYRSLTPKLDVTDLRDVEFLQIPPRLVLLLFDVSRTDIWNKLPRKYQLRTDFLKNKKA